VIETVQNIRISMGQLIFNLDTRLEPLPDAREGTT